MIVYTEPKLLPLSTQLVSLLSDCFSTYETRTALVSRITPLLASENSFFTAFIGEELCGVVILSSYSKDAYIIEALAVKKDYRRQTIATNLIERWSESHTPKSIALETDEESLGFYLQNGFEVVKVEQKYGYCERYQLVRNFG